MSVLAHSSSWAAPLWACSTALSITGRVASSVSGINSGSSQGEGSYFPSVSPFFSLPITEEVCPDLLASQLLCRSPGGQAVHFPQ